MKINNPLKYQEKILSNIVVCPSGCWLWTLCYGNDGYGQIKYNRKTNRAHRVSYAAFISPIPSGMVVCHSCDTPACVNPKHLWVGTVKENNDDKLNKKRDTRKNRTHCPQGHEYNFENTFYKIVKGYSCRNCRACDNARCRKNSKKRTLKLKNKEVTFGQ